MPSAGPVWLTTVSSNLCPWALLPASWCLPGAFLVHRMGSTPQVCSGQVCPGQCVLWLLPATHSYSVNYFLIRSSTIASRAFSNFHQPGAEPRGEKEVRRNSSSTVIQSSFALGKHEGFGSAGASSSVLSSTKSICFVGRKLNIIF